MTLSSAAGRRSAVENSAKWLLEKGEDTKKAAMRRRACAEWDSGSCCWDCGKDGFLGTFVEEANTRDLKLTFVVFRNQQITNSGKELADIEPSLRLFKFKDVVIINWIVDT